jgi:release factor glutamine methyltransferase
MQQPDAASDGSRSVQSALTEAARSLKHAGVEDASNDARRLLAAALRLAAAQLLAQPQRQLTPEQADAFARYVTRRAAREPVSRILGEREFYGRTFKLSPATLDPRPDSETLIDVTLSFVDKAGLRSAPLRILDVGTGSGCLLATLLCELPNAMGLGTDLSQDALRTASDNAQRLGVGARAAWRIADALENVDGAFDILVCNPPYIRSAVIAELEPEVRDFDPLAALDGGSDGLAVYRRLAPRITTVVPSGWAVLEVGYDQAEAVAELLASATGGRNLQRLSLHTDVAGKRRCVALETRA